MSLNVLQKINKSMVKMEPYPHVIIEDALPSNIYDELDAAFPEKLLLSDHPGVYNDRGHTRRYLSARVLEERIIKPIWLDFFEYHVSEDFYKRVTNEIFVDAIKLLYPDQSEQILNTPINRRSKVNQITASTPIVTDCQFVVNKPLEENTTSRTPHIDNPMEIYAALLYMKKRDDDSIGGDLQLYETVGDKTRFFGKREAKLDSVRMVGSCPYKANSLALFLNCRDGVHGVGNIKNQRNIRRSINIIGEYGDGRTLFKI